MSKVALVSSLGTSEWISCQFISNNLIKAYEAISYLKFERIFITDSMTPVDHWHAARQILDGKFDKIFFIEHSPHPGLIFHFLNEMNPNYKPEIVVHIYGDFILYSQKWLEASALCSTFKIRFVVASNKQKELLEKVFENNQGQIDVIPFPVDSKQFYFSSELRTKLRNQNNIEKDEKIILYTGRLSSQKNIIELLQIFDAVQKNLFSNTKLYLAGPIDDIGLPYFGKSGDPGQYNFYLQRFIKKLFKNERSDKVLYLGNLTQMQLLKQYHLADLYISLSTHQDEDYGMAPAEALMSGLPVMLSDWGGYTDFLTSFKTDSYLVKTFFSDSKANIDSNLAIKTLALALSDTEKNREELSRKAYTKLSIEGVSNNLKQILKIESYPAFLGFNDLFKSVAQAFKIDPLAPFGEGPKASKLYQEIYCDYGT